MKRFLLILVILTAIPVPAHAVFKASTVAVEGALSKIRQQAAATKTYLQAQRGLMVAPTVSAAVPRSVISHLATVIPMLTTLAATPGLVTYARAQLNDNTYDIATEFTAMRTRMVSVLDNLVAMFPKDGNGFVLYETLDADGVFTVRTFTSAQVAPAVALLDTLIASIE